MSFPPPFGTELVEEIGAGTVFHVAIVRDAAGRLLACKRLVPRASGERAARVALARESKALALARHPSIPEVLGYGTDGAGPFLLETRLEGVALRHLVEVWTPRGGVPEALLLHLAKTAAEALAELHELGDATGPLELVHGDLSPDHVILRATGEVGLLDWGASRWRGISAALDVPHRGTLPYAAPEVVRGEARADAAADVHALAASLAFALLGRPACEARDEAAVLAEIGERGARAEWITASGRLPEGALRALAGALHPDPARRGTARALALALAAWR